MEKLELKHLAPYIPCGLKVSSIHTLHTENGIGNINQIIQAVNDGKIQYKPILRPLSDLTKEIEHNGERFVPMSKIYGNPLDYKIEMVSFGVVQKLFEWHFDVFGLIEKGLAIDINTLYARV